MTISQRIWERCCAIEARSGRKAKKNLYLGRREIHELREMTRRMPSRIDPRYIGARASWDGMDIYVVDAATHLEVHVVE